MKDKDIADALLEVAVQLDSLRRLLSNTSRRLNNEVVLLGQASVTLNELTQELSPDAATVARIIELTKDPRV